MEKELSQKSRKRISVGAWFLIVLQVIALVGLVIDRQERDPAIESFLRQPTASATAGTIGYLIGMNIIPLVALIGGITLWRHDKSKESKTIIAVATIAIIASSVLIFR